MGVKGSRTGWEDGRWLEDPFGAKAERLHAFPNQAMRKTGLNLIANYAQLVITSMILKTTSTS